MNAVARAARKRPRREAHPPGCRDDGPRHAKHIGLTALGVEVEGQVIGAQTKAVMNTWLAPTTACATEGVRARARHADQVSPIGQLTRDPGRGVPMRSEGVPNSRRWMAIPQVQARVQHAWRGLPPSYQIRQAMLPQHSNSPTDALRSPDLRRAKLSRCGLRGQVAFRQVVQLLR